jgi:ribosomal protein S25
MSEPKIEALSVLSLRPGDTLIVRVPNLTEENAEKIKQLVRSQITVDVPVIVTAPGIEFSIARPSEPTR